MRSSQTNSLSLPHLPTWLLIIGYPVYWLELNFHRENHGVSSALALSLFALMACAAFLKVYRSAGNKKFSLELPVSPLRRLCVLLGGILCLVILAVSLYAAFLPPHLPQEQDVLNYHYTFPRQHLIRNSFDYIRWSTCDLFTYPVQFGLAPYWFMTELPNKIPQYLFLLAIPFLMVRLMAYLAPADIFKKALVVFAVLGAHHVGIQAGTAMLDLVLSYLFLAALESLLSGNWIMAAVEFVFYFWSKPFIPFQIIAVGSVAGIIIFVLKTQGFKFNLGFAPKSGSEARINKKVVFNFTVLFFILSIFVGGPFLLKSLKVAATPIYPFFVGIFPQFQNSFQMPWDWQEFVKAANLDLAIKDAYGVPRTGLEFIKHFWLVAVPQNGVNNIFDYPLGLVYLLCLGPFIVFFIRGVFLKRIAVLPLCILLLWLSWWFGSQQSRFLFVPLFLMYLTVIAELQTLKIFSVALIVALLSTTVSVFRAHKPDFGKAGEEVLNEEDKVFLDINKEYIFEGRKDIVEIDYFLAAYAQFPARVVKENLPYVLQIKKSHSHYKTSMIKS